MYGEIVTKLPKEQIITFFPCVFVCLFVFDLQPAGETLYITSNFPRTLKTTLTDTSLMLT